MSSPSLELLRRGQEPAEPDRVGPVIQDSLAPPTPPVQPNVLAPVSSAELLAMQQATVVLSAPQLTNPQPELGPSNEILRVSSDVVAGVGARLGDLRVRAGFRTPPSTPTGRTQALREAGPNN